METAERASRRAPRSTGRERPASSTPAAPAEAAEGRVDEALVARLWRAQRFQRGALRTAEGTSLHVVYPGRRRGERGPDFQDALLAFGAAALQRGGVEVHLRSSDWARHGHHRDPAYDATLLHVVLWHDARAPVRRHDGSPVPTLALAGYLTEPLPTLATTVPAESPEWPRNERGQCGHDPADVIARLEAAGLARFAERQAAFAAELEERSAADLLGIGLVEAVGYGANRAPARALAARLSPEALRAAAGAGLVSLEALLLGAAGLLPSQRDRPAEAPTVAALEAGAQRDCAAEAPAVAALEAGAQRDCAAEAPAVAALEAGAQRDCAAEAPAVAALEAVWQRLAGAVTAPLPASDWRFFGVRPASYPPRRLAGVARLLGRTPADRLVADAARALRTLAPRPAARALAAALVVDAAAGYWRDHWDFGRASARPLPALLGPERAAEIVVNVVLPLLAAWGDVLDDAALTAAARACYLAHPPAGDNERLRHMRQQVLGGADRAATGTACRQQGLLHVYEKTCGWRRCGACAVGPGTRAEK